LDVSHKLYLSKHEKTKSNWCRAFQKENFNMGNN
jgi:hypothetical protein